MARRILIWLSFAAALVFYLGETNGQGASVIAVKGSAVGLLAGAALWPPLEKGSSWFAAILVCGAAGDVAIEFSVIAGAACFLAGHLLAVAFYRRNRRQSGGGAGLVLAVLLVLLVPLVANFMSDNRTIAPLASLYALGLAAMAASAWSSRFSRANVGLGALLFVASDLLIFARLGPLAESPLPRLAVWPLYYAGQLLIYRGVIAGLRRPAHNVITDV